MDTRTRPFLSVQLFLLLFLCLLHQIQLSIAADTILPGQSLSGNQTIVSKDDNFEMGFFTPGNSHNYYIGIWFKKISIQTVVWVANREKPITDTSSSVLRLSGDGNLVLIDYSKSQIWSTKSTPPSSNSTVAVLMDNGNLVLMDGLNSSAIIWQSFDHPTDTWLPGAKLGLNKVTGENMLLTSWRSSEDPAPGSFSFGIDPDGSSQYITWWNGSQQYWRTGLWNGLYFSSVAELTTLRYLVFNYVNDDREIYFTYYAVNNLSFSGFVIDVSGQIRRSLWSQEEWILFWSQPDQCKVYSVCGAFSVCNLRKLPFCTCLQGYKEAIQKEWDLNDFSGGCVRKSHLNCGSNISFVNGEKDKFFGMPEMQLPANSKSLAVGSAEGCESSCLENCSCKAYSYTSECLQWSGDLLNLQQVPNGGTNGETLYIRLASTELPSTGRKKQSVTGVIIGAIGGSVAFLGIAFVLYQRRGQIGIPKVAEGGSLALFRYRHLQHVTNNFSQRLGGGGFGSVFKGKLPDLTIIAVKKLEGLGQGEKQFRTEVSTLGTIQHVNLVRLLGFCSEGAKRLLVYEYMPNGSLDSFLFRNNSELLKWEKRFQIMLGTARGLAYLHQECRDCIIHCDVKPENILLDAEFNPKVADFGMAKLIGREFSRALTTMRGTIGYLAPEWISGEAITPKADVYSLGLVLLEIISGRRNTKPCEEGRYRYFPILAANKVIEGEVLCLLDEKLEGDADMGELTRACRVACWCIQGNESQRPSMGQVVQILEGVLEVDMPPIPSSLLNLLDDLVIVKN